MAAVIAKLQKCIKKRERLFSNLQVCFDLIKELPGKEKTFIARCTDLSTLYDKFEEVQSEIDELNSALDAADKIDTIASSKQFDILYYEIQAVYQSLRSSLETTTIKSSEVKPKLPQINIQKFSGQIEHFNSFHSLYENLIHRTDLSDIEKFSYLKSLLEGPALTLIETIHFSSDNYQLAYDTLVNRYTNPRVVACHYFNKILELQPLKTPTFHGLRNIVDALHINIEALKALKLNDLSDFLFLQLAVRILDNNTRKAFEREYQKVEFPTFENLVTFLRNQCTIYELTKDDSKTAHISKNSVIAPRKVFVTTNISNATNCPLCKNAHSLFRCQNFLSMSTEQRYEIARSNKRCFNCLGTHHISTCKSRSLCRFCGSNTHHSLLHKTPYTVSHSPDSTVQKANTEKVNLETTNNASNPQVLSCQFRNQSHQILLGTALVYVQDSLGNWFPCRAVIDSGSQLNFISSSLAQILNLPRTKYSVEINGIGEHSSMKSKGLVSCTLKSHFNFNNILHMDAVVIPRICAKLPSLPLRESIKEKFASLQLADFNFSCPSNIDILIGAPSFIDILSDNSSIIKGQPSAFETIFGWVLIGEVPYDSAKITASSLFACTPQVDDILCKFWEMEEIYEPVPMKEEDLQCENHYSSTISRDEIGRYVAHLPFKFGQRPDLGSTRSKALRNFAHLEKRFSSQPEFYKLYRFNIQDYLDQDHLKLVGDPASYILTHHGVFKDSSTTQLRVVFNASLDSDSNMSLNKSLMTGPKLQTDISLIITNFRFFKIALTCDIKQMYRAIRLAPEDCKYQRFFWRFDVSEPIQEWELQRLTFGVSSSPFIAQRTLQQLVVDEGFRFPNAADILGSCCYVDDIVFGANSEQEALNLYQDLTNLLSTAHFELRKWASSSNTVLESIAEEHREKPHPLGTSNSIKVLGLEWDPTTDCFRYNFTSERTTATKRTVLSQIARIYDINGYLSPVIFSLKHLMQQIWIAKLDWDDPLPPKINRIWLTFLDELPLLGQLNIPRYILSSYVHLQLVGFSDASTIGMCAVVYLRVICSDGTILCNNIQSKTKVAPLKSLTVPRLELCAALLLSKLIFTLHPLILKWNIGAIFLFSDSTNVLGWLHTPPHLLHTFVAHRVVQILDHTSINCWRHISGDLNPADCGSRGLLISQLLVHSLWWHGPQFLRLDESSWPNTETNLPSVLPDLKSPRHSALLMQHDSNTYLYEHISRFSSFIKVQRVFAFVLRFLHNCRNQRANRIFESLSPVDYENALRCIIKIVQNQYYSAEILSLRQGQTLTTSIKTLSPFLLDDILMVGGRIKSAPLSERARHPYLIPPKSHLALLLCNHYHIYSLHGGPRLVQSLMQRKFWIPGARNLIRSCIFRCLTCYRFRAKPMHPLMSDLPPSRFKQGRCFLNVGLDFGGPFFIKESSRRNARLTKIYIALFVCLSVKAIHLEIVFSLTTEACLAAIDRFISRRGLPNNIYSDQGRNFLGAARHLKEIYDLIKESNENIIDHLSKREIKWHFNPPYAPNFGGIWEAGIKSTKGHLTKALHERHFTAEEFITVLCRIEAILNSRPLCQVSNLPDDDFDYLSPGHFLTGAPLLSRPENDMVNEPQNLLSRWKAITQATQSFWKRWSHEYIHTQIQRPKWHNATQNLKEGDLVLTYLPSLPPLSWPLARIEKVFPGQDNVVRVAQIRTPSGHYTRPVNKLIPLPLVV